MRVLTVLFALVATPLLVCVSQGLPGKSTCTNGNSTANRSAQGTAHAHKGLCAPQDPPGVVDSDGDGVADNLDTCANTPAGTQVDASGCPVQSTPPPPTGGCVNSQMTGGTSTIRGQVYVDQAPLYSLLGGWCVELKDASTGALVASMLSSATALNGDGDNYVFTGVPVGTYVVCEIPQPGWHQSFPTSGPACSPNAGIPVPIAADGSDAPFNWFGNLTP